MIKKLIRRYDCDPKLASFRQHRIDPASVGNEVLYFVAIDAIDRPLLASEERILNHGEEEACEGDCLLTQSSLREVDEDPVALIHRFTDRKRRLCLSDDMSEVRVGGEDRCFVENRLAHRCPHRLARLVEAHLEVLPYFGVGNSF